MFMKLLAMASTLTLSMTVAIAAVDANSATEAELDGIKGLGPATSRLIMDERKKSEFKNWPDFIKRVKGVGSKSASRYSAEGLTVDGAAYLVRPPLTSPANAVKE
ncbi:MAG: hypothetical protein JWR74_2921 [Polaromonas sp.]|jgi:competence protein ComEA|nr:hypothetical protein [Polaromonas sp.]